MDSLKTISAVINTLNQITVSGEGNLDKLLGCIMALKQVKEQLEQPPEIVIDEIGTQPGPD